MTVRLSVPSMPRRFLVGIPVSDLHDCLITPRFHIARTCLFKTLTEGGSVPISADRSQLCALSMLRIFNGFPHSVAPSQIVQIMAQILPLRTPIFFLMYHGGEKTNGTVFFLLKSDFPYCHYYTRIASNVHPHLTCNLKFIHKFI